MHLTNYRVNKSSANWVEESDVSDILEPNGCSKRTLAALWKELNNAEMVETIKANIRDTCAGTMSLLSNYIHALINPQAPESTKKPV